MKSHNVITCLTLMLVAHAKAEARSSGDLCGGAVNCEVVDGRIQFKVGMGPDSEWYQENVLNVLNETDITHIRREEPITSTIWGSPRGISYGSTNPGDILHQLFEACGEHGCVSDYTIPEDTHFVIGAGAGYTGTQQASAQIALEIYGLHTGYNQRNALIDALTATARQGFESEDKSWELTQYIANPMGGTWTVISEGSQTEYKQSSQYKIHRRLGSSDNAPLIDMMDVRIKVTMGDYNTFPCELIKSSITAAVGFFLPVVADMLGSVIPACD